MPAARRGRRAAPRGWRGPGAALTLALGGCGLASLGRQPPFDQPQIVVGPIVDGALSDLAEPVTRALERRLARAGLHPHRLSGRPPASLSGQVRLRWTAPAGERTTAGRCATAALTLTLADAAGAVRWRGEVEAEATRLPMRAGPWAATVDHQALGVAEAELAEQLAEAAWGALRAAGAAR